MSIVTDEMVEKARRKYTDSTDEPSSLYGIRKALEAVADDIIEACAKEADKTVERQAGFVGQQMMHFAHGAGLAATAIRDLKSTSTTEGQGR